MYELSSRQVNMFVRAIMPELYRLQAIHDKQFELDIGKPPDQQHQKGFDPDPPGINDCELRLTELKDNEYERS